MFKITLWKSIVCGSIFLIGFLPPRWPLRLILVEILGGPLRKVLMKFPGLFFIDKPYYNYPGGVVVLTTYALLIYLIWSLIQFYFNR